MGVYICQNFSNFIPQIDTFYFMKSVSLGSQFNQTMGIKKGGGVPPLPFCHLVQRIIYSILLAQTLNISLKRDSSLSISIAQSYFRSQECSPHPPHQCENFLSFPTLAPLNSSQHFLSYHSSSYPATPLMACCHGLPLVYRLRYRFILASLPQIFIGRGRPSALLAKPFIYRSLSRLICSHVEFLQLYTFVYSAPATSLALPFLPSYVFLFLRDFLLREAFPHISSRCRYLRTFYPTLTQHRLVIAGLCL